jgi:hypothetical protein
MGQGWQYAGCRMTILSASDEKWVENDILHAKMYFNMAQALSVAGVLVVKFFPLLSAILVLILGHNPTLERGPIPKGAH